MKRIMITEILLLDRIKFTTQNRNYKFLSLFIYIYTNGIYLPPSFIYKSKSRSFQDIWLENWNLKEMAYFSTTTNG